MAADDTGLMHDRVHVENGPVRAGRSARTGVVSLLGDLERLERILDRVIDRQTASVDFDAELKSLICDIHRRLDPDGC